MQRSFQFFNVDSLPRPEDYEVSSSEECDDPFFHITNDEEQMGSTPNLNRNISESLSASTPCMSDSRPSSSVDTGCDWDDSLLRNVATSDSCLVSTAGSSSAASPLMRIASPGLSPSAETKMMRSYPFGCTEDQEASLVSLNEALKTERDFIDFVMASFPLGEKPSDSFPEGKKCVNDCSPKVGLDHLDNLCKLMEQLSDLKEANVRLKRRVQYLEDVKTLHEIHKEMTAEPKLSNSGPSEDDDKKVLPRKTSPRSFTNDAHGEEALLDLTERPHWLYRSKTTASISKNQEMKRGSLHKSRTTSSVNQDRIRERSKSVGHSGPHSKTKKRASRWSKVKEALGIERIDNDCDEQGTDGSCRCEQRCEGPTSRTANESVDSQRLMCDDEIEKKTASSTKSLNERCGPRSRNNGLSSHSFSKFYHDAVEVKTEKKSGTLDCPKSAQRCLAEYEKDDSFKKSPKSPWCKMKNIIQIRRDNRHHKSETRSNSSRNAKGLKTEEHHDPEHQSSSNHQRRSSKNYRDQVLKENRRTNYENSSTHSDREKFCEVSECSCRDSGAVPLQRHKRSQFKEKADGCDLCVKQQGNDRSLQRTCSHSNSEKQERHSSSSKSHSSISPTSKENGKRKKPKPRPLNLQDNTNRVPCENVQSTEDDRDTPKSPESSPPPIHRKWMWTRVKDVLRGKRDDGARLSISVPSSPSSSADVVAFNFQPVEGEALAEDSIAALPSYSKADVLGLEMREADAVLQNPTMSDLLQELQRNLSDDFNKKLDEWQKLRSEDVRIPNLSVERKDSFGRLKKFSKFDKKFTTGEKTAKQANHIPKKDINWLEKELQKVEREIVRLSKEKQKSEKRAIQLKRLKDAMTDNHQKKEVLVRTSAGEFRFEGISDAFTKKLYEWETKNGVLPELSTIALLDECLQGKHEKFHDALKMDRLTATSERGGLSSQSSRSSLSPDSTIKTCFQASRASSEPDLSSLSAQKEGSIQTRSKSGDTLLSTSHGEKPADCIITAVERPSTEDDQWASRTRDRVQTEDSYYCLLEENMFLLDQLKSKEELCRQLKNELDRVDNKSDKTNKTHQEEMEKYRMKLWELHMSRPRDLQGSLHVISELKKRIEELQKCSDRLKSDRESLEMGKAADLSEFDKGQIVMARLLSHRTSKTARLVGCSLSAVVSIFKTLSEEEKARIAGKMWANHGSSMLEESFRYHSEQQSQLTRDLTEKLRDLQEAGQLGFFHRSGCRRKCRKQVKCDLASVTRIHYLTTMLLQQGREMEVALMERTRQVCHLRWELLQRDMSAVLLQAALHRVNCQGDPTGGHLSAWSKRRNRFKPNKSWTIDSTSRCQSQECVTEPWSQERLRQITVTPYATRAVLDYNPNELMATIHELKKEALKMSCFRFDRFSEVEDTVTKTANGSAESEMADSDRLYDTGSTVNSRSSSFSSGPSGLRGSHSDTRLYERSRDFCNRRNSSSSMSCLSGMDASDSSSIHDSDRMRLLMRRRPWTRWRSRDNISTPCSSQSSVMEDEMNICKWDQMVDADDFEDGRHPKSQLQIRCTRLNEDEEHDDRNDGITNSFAERGSQCLITPRPLHLALNVEDGDLEDGSLQSFSNKMRVSPSNCGMKSVTRHPQDRNIDYKMFCVKETSIEHVPDELNGNLSTKSINPFSVLDENETNLGNLVHFNDTDEEQARQEDFYDSSENSEMTYLKVSPFASCRMMDDKKASHFSSILYPSLNPSPYNSGDDMGYTFSKQHTNTDESNTSPEHSEMEVLNISHPVHDFLLYSTYPPQQVAEAARTENHEFFAGVNHEVRNSLLHRPYSASVPSDECKHGNSFSTNRENVFLYTAATDENKSNSLKNLFGEIPLSKSQEQTVIQEQIHNQVSLSSNPRRESKAEGSYSKLPVQINSESSEMQNIAVDQQSAHEHENILRNTYSSQDCTASTSKPQNIAQIKYKGTKGFGKCTKWEFMRETEKSQLPNHAAAFSFATAENTISQLTQPESNGADILDSMTKS